MNNIYTQELKGHSNIYKTAPEYLKLQNILPSGGEGEKEIVQLTLEGGYNWDFEGDKVRFKDDGTNPEGSIGKSCIGGVNWAKAFEDGQKHVFTVSIASNDTTIDKLYISALDCEIDDQYKQYTSNIVATGEIDPKSDNELTLEVTIPYKAVYLYKKNGSGNWESVDISSVMLTIFK